MKLRQVIISFWFKELEYNPICKVGELENSLSIYFQSPFLINEQEAFQNIAMPRIIANSTDNKSFNMSLVNANINILLLENSDKDEVIMKINEITQFLYDILKEIYQLDILYTSIKVELSEVVNNKLDIQKDIFKDNSLEFEDFYVKTSICKDNKYYINRIINLNKEIKVDIKLPKNAKPIEHDMVTRSMLVSLNKSKETANVKNKIVEINNRLSFNNDETYLVTKDDLRNLLFEFRNLLNDEI